MKKPAEILLVLLLALLCGCTIKPVVPESDMTVTDSNKVSSNTPPQTDVSANFVLSSSNGPSSSSAIATSKTESLPGRIPRCEKVSYREDPVGCIQYFLWQKACDCLDAGFDDAFESNQPPHGFILGIADLNSDSVPELLFHDTGPGSKVYGIWLYDISGEIPVLVGKFSAGGGMQEVYQIQTEDDLQCYLFSSAWGNTSLSSYSKAFVYALPDGSFDIWECQSLDNSEDAPQATRKYTVQHNGVPIEDPGGIIAAELLAQPGTPCSDWFHLVTGWGDGHGVHIDSECQDPWWQSYAKAAVELYYS